MLKLDHQGVLHHHTMGLHWRCALVFVAILLVQVISLNLRIPPLLVAPVWLPGGLIIGVMCVTAVAEWPWIAGASLLAGIFAASFMTFQIWAAEAIILMTLACGALVAILLGTRPGQPSIQTPRLERFLFIGVAVVELLLVPPATVLVMVVRHYQWEALATTAANGPLGVVVVGSGVIALCDAYRNRGTRGRGSYWRPAVSMRVSGVILGSMAAFWVADGTGYSQPLSLLPLPFLLLSASRGTVLEVAVSLLAMVIIACRGARAEMGPFRMMSPIERTLAVQLCLLGVSTPLVLVAAAVRERRFTEASLEQQKDRYQRFFSRSPLAIIGWNRAGIIEEWNPEAERLFGYTAEETVGSSALALFFGSQTLVPTEAKHRVLLHRTKDGREILVAWHAQRGLGTSVFAMAEDITERVDAEKQIQQQLKFEALVGEISPLLVGATPDTLDGLLNDALARIAEGFHGDRVVFGQIDEQTGELVSRAHAIRTGLPFPRRLVISERYPMLWAALSRGEVVHIPDTQLLPDDCAIDRGHYKEVGILSQVGVPILLNGELRFMLTVAATRERRVWSEHSVQRLRVLAEALSGAALRCKAEMVLRASEQLFRAFVQNAPVPIMINPGIGGPGLYVNPAITTLLGYSAEELATAEDWWRLAHPEAGERTRRREVWAQSVEMAGRSGRVEESEDIEVTAKDGTRRYVRASLKMVQGHRLIFLSDLTNRRKSEALLRLTQYAVDKSPIMILRLDTKGRFIYANDAACQQTGYSHSELLAMHSWDVAVTFSEPDWVFRLQRYREQGNLAMETVYRRKNGALIPVELRVHHVLYDGEESLFCFAVDITARKNAQQAAHANLRRLAEIATELTNTEERQRRELATVLHDDVGQNLFAATTQLVTLRNCSPEATPIVERIVNILDEVSRQTRELTFELYPPVLYQIGLSQALRRLADQFTARYGIPCVAEGETAGPDDLNLRGLAYQVVRELLTNIAKHARASKAEIHLQQDRDHVTILVADDGRGFDPERLKNAKGGFGLFHLRERLDLLGGSISIDSQTGSGCRTTVLLPLHSPLTAR